MCEEAKCDPVERADYSGECKEFLHASRRSDAEVIDITLLAKENNPAA